MPSPPKNPELSVVILGYRSEERLIPVAENVIRVLREAKTNFEVILVANYDTPTDLTPQVARRFARKEPHCHTLAELKKGRMGWDLRQGLNKARGEYVTFIDGDGQIPPEDITRLLFKARDEKLMLAKIYRAERDDPALRKVLSKVYNFIFRLFFPGTGMRDINAKPKLLTLHALKSMQLTSDDWFADAEIILEARRLKLKTGEIPSKTIENNWRKSFIGPAAVLEFMRNLILYRIRYWFFR